MHVGREPLDVAGKVLGDVVEVAREPLEIERPVTAKRKPLPATRFRLASRAWPSGFPLQRSCSARTVDIGCASTQSKCRGAVVGNITRSNCGGRQRPPKADRRSAGSGSRSSRGQALRSFTGIHLGIAPSLGTPDKRSRWTKASSAWVSR